MSIHHRQRQVILPRVVPNAGLQAYYRKRLDRLIEAMHDSVAYWVAQAYRANPPEIAQDESPAMAMRRLMRKLASRWNREFDKLSRKLSPEFVRRNGRMSDTQFMEHLKAAGFTVEFSVSRQVNDVMQAAIGENVALINSIPQQYLTQVEGMVLRSVQAGRDLSTLSKDLQHQYGVTRRRAAFIARDQNNKTTSAIYRARQLELDIDEAIWHHSHAGKTPRPSHVANNGKTYKVSEGWYDPDLKKRIWPGTEPNCRCTAKSIIRGFI